MISRRLSSQVDVQRGGTRAAVGSAAQEAVECGGDAECNLHRDEPHTFAFRGPTGKTSQDREEKGVGAGGRDAEGGVWRHGKSLCQSPISMEALASCIITGLIYGAFKIAGVLMEHNEISCERAARRRSEPRPAPRDPDIENV